MIVVLGCAAELATFARSDMAFLLYAAERVLDGARLYVDVVEINPPLIIALNLPAVLGARALDVPAITVLRLVLGLTLVGSLAFSAWAVRRSLGPDQRHYRLLVLLLASILFLAPGDDFGQREHLLVALAMPYVLLAAARAEGRPVPAGPAFAAGLLAGTGLALKPHFLLVWVAIEAYAAWRTGARRPSWESLGTIVFLLAYATAVALLTPDFFRMALLLGPVYGWFGRYPFYEVVVTAPGVTECFVAALTCLALYRHARHRTLWSVVLIGLVASFLGGAAQQKAWTYHFYPPKVFALLLLGLAVLDVRRPFSRPVQRIYAAVAFAVLGTSLLWALGVGFSRVLRRDPIRESERAQLNHLVAALRRHAPPGGSFYVFSYTIGSSFPLVNYSGLRWASRFPHLWIIEAVYHRQLHARPPLRFRAAEEMGPAERYLNDAVYEDLARNRPDVLMVLRHARDIEENTLRRLDYLAYFGRDPRIAGELRWYRYVEEAGQYRVYVRAPALDQPGMAPTSLPGEYDILRSQPAGAPALVADREFLLHLLIFAILGAVGYVVEGRRCYGRETAVVGHESA